jgi:hypothetical protein
LFPNELKKDSIHLFKKLFKKYPKIKLINSYQPLN